jgi:hypothetical protein
MSCVRDSKDNCKKYSARLKTGIGKDQQKMDSKEISPRRAYLTPAKRARDLLGQDTRLTTDVPLVFLLIR